MSQSINYSFSFKVGGAARPADDLSALLIRDALTFHSVGGDQYLAVNRNTLRSGVVNSNVAPVLDRLDYFRSIPEHRQAIRKALPDFPASDDEMTAVIQHLYQNGLLISAQEFLDRLAGPRQSAHGLADTPWMLSILTCDRPRLLARLLESSAVYLRTMAPGPRIVLIDDSRDAGNVEQNQRMFRDWLQNTGLMGDYWGRAARMRLVDELGGMWPDQGDVIQWLLSPLRFPQFTTIGQARNTATLLGAGCKQLTLDDDCYVEPRSHAFNRPGLRLNGGDQDLFLYSSSDELFAATRPESINPFQAHLDALGQALPDLFVGLGLDYHDSAWLRELPAEMLASLAPDATVGISVNSTLGDPGTASMDWLYTRTEESAARVARFIEARQLPDSLPRLMWKGRRTHLAGARRRADDHHPDRDRQPAPDSLCIS